ncbi:hypothetical protein LguiB_026852 [Lonicera macranthoides]
MESDDEWITEKEDPCLPQDNSWHECFQHEGTSSKRKRGPRNLNAIKNKRGRGIVIVIGENVQVVDDEDEEYEVEKEEDGDLIFVDDDDDDNDE